ncbi:hypothetical protein GCM10023185_13130 [Hymenobacter saemangeumensis]|uniref:Transglycosylase SLT domain-containing protein n=1 Tax=Hymenobacter saemangeumensis TaxID=1084522 RepID=A0ABP8I7F9_9BACT
MKLSFEEYVPATVRAAFVTKVRQVAERLNVKPDWLMGAMYCESGFNAQAVNRFSGATGLIQFMPKTAANLGTTTAALAAMPAVQQLDYVERYFRSHATRLRQAKDWLDLYLVVFYPVAVGKPDSYVLGSQTPGTPAQKAAMIAKIATQNAIYAKEGVVTVGSIRAHFEKKPAFVALKKKEPAATV